MENTLELYSLTKRYVSRKISKKALADVSFTLGRAFTAFWGPVVTPLGNLLDNALEACRKLPDSSYINVKILKKEEDFLLSVENSSLPVKISENKYVPTDKAEPRLHGFGLQNIAHIMQKYGYEYTLFYHDARFHFVSILS